MQFYECNDFKIDKILAYQTKSIYLKTKIEKGKLLNQMSIKFCFI